MTNNHTADVRAIYRNILIDLPARGKGRTKQNQKGSQRSPGLCQERRRRANLWPGGDWAGNPIGLVVRHGGNVGVLSQLRRRDAQLLLH